MATSDSSPDLDPKVAQAIQDAMDALRAELLGHLKPEAGPAPAPEAGGTSLNRLEDAIEALDSAGTQTELLASLLQESGAFADRSLFLVRDGDELRGWAAFGFSGGDEDVQRVSVALPSEIADRRPADDPAAGESICDSMAASRALESIMVPFSLRGKVAGALYADCARAGDLGRPALRILSYVAAQAVETLPLRRAAQETAAVAPVDDLATPTEDLAAPAEFDIEDEVTVELDTQEAEDAAAGFGLQTDPEVDVDVERMIEEVERPPYDEVEDEDIVAIRHDVTPAGFEPVVEEAPEAEADSAEDFDTGRYETAVEEIERETREEREDEAPATEEATPEPVPATEAPVVEGAPTVEVEPPARVIEDAEVAPPADLEGPGWAFSGSESISEDTRHEEASRLARLLVTEIKLYNEEKVREGREANDIYDRLRDDIERSRRIYEERIDDEIRDEGDYFQEEVVRILAGGDSTALGL